PNKPLFMTDDPNYARSYSSDVKGVTVNRYEFLKVLRDSGGNMYKGIHTPTGNQGTEIMITNPALKEYILNHLKVVH
ncbi:MAG: hypothetical protein IJO84_04175, partial [Butyricimonas sp.]|nr:hypothetical protein [Butyricimonas sp.]